MQTIERTIDLTGQAEETIELQLPAGLLHKIRAEAARRGTDAGTVLAEAAAEKVARLEERPHAGMTFRELLAPLAEDFRNAGLTDAALGDLLDAEIQSCRAEPVAAIAAAPAGVPLPEEP